jgi:hypothetical protein
MVPWELCAPVGCGFKQVEKKYSTVTSIRCRGSAVHLRLQAGREELLSLHFDKVPRELCATVGCDFKQIEKKYSTVTLIRCHGSSAHLSAAASSR